MITLVRYDTNIQECRPMLDEYYLHHDTPDNNASDRALKLSLCDGHNGVIWFLVDDQKIIATFGALAVQVTPGIKAIKMPHRLHVRKSHTANHNEFIDKWFEPALYPWIASTGITNIMMTMNEGNEHALFLSGFRHDRRRRSSLMLLSRCGKPCQPSSVDDPIKAFLTGWSLQLAGHAHEYVGWYGLALS